MSVAPWDENSRWWKSQPIAPPRKPERHWDVEQTQVLRGAALKGDQGIPLISINDALRMYGRPEIHGGDIDLTSETLRMIL